MTISMLTISSQASTDDELISILSITLLSNKSEKVEYLIHDNKLYISKEDTAFLTDRICDEKEENGFYRYFPGPEKQEDGSWIIIPNKYKGATNVFKSTNEIYTYNNKTYYPLKSVMDFLETSYYYDGCSCAIMYTPSYTYTELMSLCKAYASCRYIVSSSGTFNTTLGKTGFIMATAYDVFINVRFSSIFFHQYTPEKYEGVLQDVIYPKLTSDNDFVDLGIEGDSIMGSLSSLYKITDIDPEQIKVYCDAVGYGTAMIEAYDIFDDLLPGLSVGDFFRVLDITRREYFGSVAYMKAVYYGLEAPGNLNIEKARNHLIPEKIDHWSYEELLLQAFNDYVDRLKKKAVTDVAVLITDFDMSYYKAIAKITDLILNNFIPVGQAVDDCIDLKYSGALQQVALKNISISAYPYQAKYCTLLYLLLSSYEAKKVGMDDCAVVTDMMCNCLLVLPDKGKNTVNNQEIDIVKLKNDYRRLELSAVDSIVLYHIAYMFSNSGEDSIRMIYKDANSDGIEDLLIQHSNGKCCSAIIPGGTYDNSIQLCDSITGEETLDYSPTYGSFIRLVYDEEAPVKDYYYRYETYNMDSDLWLPLFETKYDENVDGSTRYFILGDEVCYSDYMSVYETLLFNLSDMNDYTNERGFDSFNIQIDLSSRDIFEELAKYSVFDSSYVSDLNGDGENDYVLISQLSVPEGIPEMEYHKSRRVPNGIKEIGNGILPYFWDDACLYIISNSGSASIKWSSFAELLGELSDSELPLPDGVYDGSIENLSYKYAKDNYLLIDTFDGSDVNVSTFGIIEFEDEFVESLSEGEKINMEEFGYNTDIIVESIDDHSIGIFENNSIGIIDIYRPVYFWDSEWIAITYSDYAVHWTQYTSYMPLSDELEIEFDYRYNTNNEYHIQTIQLTDLNDCLDYLRTCYASGTEITIKDGQIVKIRLYDVELDRYIKTDTISIHYNENPQWFSLTYDQIDEKIMEHVKVIQPRDITMFEQTREVKYSSHTYSVGISYHLTDEDFGEEGYVNGNPIKQMGRVTVDLETGEAHYEDEWGGEDYWNVYE